MSGDRRAYIHIGMAKSGTTSIQHAMATNRDHLLEQGFLFPAAGAPNDKSGHHCLAWRLRDSPKLQLHCSGFRLRSLRDEVAGSPDLHVVVSSEELSGISYNYSMMKSLFALFPDREIYVVAYVREQAEFFNAFWVELASDLNCKLSLSDFVHKCLGESRYDYNDWFGTWKRLVGSRLIVRPFDPAFLVNGNVVDDFCTVVGIDDLPSVSGAEWKNRSMNARQIAATIGLSRHLERMGLDPNGLAPDRRMQVKRIVSKLVRHPQLADGEAFWGIGPELVQQVQRHYGEANRRFFRDQLGSDFIFSAVDRHRPFTAMAYEDLDRQLRARLEAELARRIAKLDSTRLAAPH